MERLTPRDERETSVDHAADRLAYLVLSFGLLAIAAYRSFVAREASWDLLALVVAGGLAGTAVRARRRVVTQRWLMVALATIAIAAVVAAIALLSTRV
jgi:hypothetical protein